MTKFSIYSKDTISGPFLAQFNHFGAKKVFPKSPALLCRTSYGFLTPQHANQNLGKKTNNPISRNCLDRRNGGTDGKTERQTLSYRTLPAPVRGTLRFSIKVVDLSVNLDSIFFAPASELPK